MIRSSCASATAVLPQLPQQPSRATFPPRTTELSAAPVLSCAQYRPAAAFPTSGPVYLRCVASSRSDLLPIHRDSNTYYTLLPLGLRLASPRPRPRQASNKPRPGSHYSRTQPSVLGLGSTPVSSPVPGLQHIGCLRLGPDSAST